MSILPFAMVAIPASAGVASLLLPSRVGRVLTAIAGVATAICILLVAWATAHGQGRTDALSALFLLPVGIVYGTVGLYTYWYVRAESTGHDERHQREFLALTNAFACAEVIIPMLINLPGAWVALEGTTLIAALLVRMQGTDAALEAAWKYILIASCGLAFGLLGVVILYASAVHALGPSYAPTWSVYLAAAHRLDPNSVRLAFVFSLVGFGTKMGLAPMHTWLPDAHGAGPTTTSAMLSGALLSDALYIILRITSITRAAVGPQLPEHIFFIVGLLSLFLGAFFLLRQRDTKRMLAYSSIEHMGLIACGLGFGAPLAIAGALLHVINHAATKSMAFYGAGRIAHRYRTREIDQVQGAVTVLPISGTLFVIAALALAGLPPFGIFRSELMILAGGLGTSRWVPAVIMIALLVVSFAGLVRLVTGMGAGDAPAVPHGERFGIASLAMVCGLVVVVGLGLFVPASLGTLLTRAADLVFGGAS